MKEEITKEFPQGKEAYCPRCYFEDSRTVLREICPHNLLYNDECHKENCPACPVTHNRGSHADDPNDTEPCYCKR